MMIVAAVLLRLLGQLIAGDIATIAVLQVMLMMVLLLLLVM